MSLISYQLKQKVWSLAKTYYIRDREDNPVYQIYGKAFSWGEKLSFQDMDGRELLKINQEIKLMPTYEVIEGDLVVATIQQQFSWFKRRFTLDIPGPNDYTITGNFWAKEFTFERMGEIVATVSKEMWAVADTYGISIKEEEDQELILATAVVVDLVCTASS